MHREDWVPHCSSSALPGLNSHLLHLSFTQCDAPYLLQFIQKYKQHRISAFNAVSYPNSKGSVSAPSSFSLSHGESVGVWECSFFLRELQQAPQPKVTFIVVNSFSAHETWQLLTPGTWVALCLPSRSVQGLEQQGNLCPWGGKKAAPEPVLRPSHSEQRCLKGGNKGQPVQVDLQCIGLLSITFQMHWLPSLAGLSLT